MKPSSSSPHPSRASGSPAPEERARTRLLTLNDSRLAAYIRAAGEAERSRELARVLTGEVHARVRTVLATYTRTESIEAPDADDLSSQVILQVLRKLRAVLLLEEESVQNLEAYVTTLTRNAVRDFLRKRTPLRRRTKNRLRSLLTHDSRLALWSRDGVTLCGLRRWSASEEYEARWDFIQRAAAAASAKGSGTEAEDIVSALAAVGKPVRLDDLVSAFTETGPVRAAPEPLTGAQPDRVEARQYLQVLWRELKDLPAPQRVALLLNLREPGSGNAVRLFVSAGIAPIEEIAAAMEMSRDALAALWDDLPLDDLRIAIQLGVQRQQVINLRKCARERLSRRMRQHSSAFTRK